MPIFFHQHYTTSARPKVAAGDNEEAYTEALGAISEAEAKLVSAADKHELRINSE
jgi:hypothetical protein